MTRVPMVCLIAGILAVLAGCRSNASRESSSSQTETTSTADAPDSAVAQPGQAPDFTLTDLQGNPIRLSDFQGKGVILDFWATWSPPCVEEIPHFVELYESNKDKGLVVIGVSLDDGRKEVVQFVKEHRVSYPILHGTPEQLRQVALAYGGIDGIPTTFLIAPDRQVVRQFIGYQDKAVFQQLLPSILPKN